MVRRPSTAKGTLPSSTSCVGGIDASKDAHPLWMDTRDSDLFLCPGSAVPGTPPATGTGTEIGGPQDGVTVNDEEIFTQGVPIPH